MIIYTHHVAGILPKKPLVAKQRPTNVRVHIADASQLPVCQLFTLAYNYYVPFLLSMFCFLSGGSGPYIGRCQALPSTYVFLDPPSRYVSYAMVKM